jgi:hypothetical protein
MHNRYLTVADERNRNTIGGRDGEGQPNGSGDEGVCFTGMSGSMDAGHECAMGLINRCPRTGDAKLT